MSQEFGSMDARPQMLLALSWVLSVWAFPQLSPPVCRGKSSGQYDPRQDHRPSDRAVAEIREAYQVLCPTNNCGTGEVYENPTVGNNAITWVSSLNDGPRTRAKIVYSAQFLNQLAQHFGPGASFGVLAHEVGHHLTAALALRQRNPFETSWDEELRADYLAGCALARSRHSPGDLDRALRALSSVATPSHPAFDQRTPVVHRGYDECGAQMVQAVQTDKTAKAAQSPFGIGAAIKARDKIKACWGFWYNDPDELERVGPIAASRFRSATFSSRSQCEAQRTRQNQLSMKNSESCTCE